MNDKASLGVVWVRFGGFLEVGVCKTDVGDEEFLAFGFDEVADVVGVFAEDEDAVVDEFEEGVTDCKAEERYAHEEGFDACGFVGFEDHD